METEFLLRPRYSQGQGKTLREFSKRVADGYMAATQPAKVITYPRMHNAIDEAYHGEKYAEWSLDSDITITVPKQAQQWCKTST